MTLKTVLGTTLDPVALAERQLTTDRARTAAFPELFTRKMQRMSASPLAFLRGAAPLFYEILAAHPTLASGPAGEGWIVGDMHLENFGAYRARAPHSASDDDDDDNNATDAKKARGVRFDVNDFDDALIAPWRYDVLRLTTSLLLGGRELGATGLVALELCDDLLAAWARTAFDGAKVPAPPAPVVALLDQVSGRSRLELLDARTKVRKNGERKFVRGSRYSDVPQGIREAVPAAFRAYAKALSSDEAPPENALEIEDYALRIAGTGSLGGVRIAVLVKGKGGRHDRGRDRESGWIFDMKEQGAPSAAVLGSAGEHGEHLAPEALNLPPGERVQRAFEACASPPPRMLGTTTLRVGKKTLSLFVRRLSPQEDKLDLRHIKAAELPHLATYLGALLGAAHARGATKAPKRWTTADLAHVRSHAIAMAGLHEATYLALCDRMRPSLPVE